MSNTWMRREACTGYDPTGLVPVVKQAEMGRRCPVYPRLPPPESSVKSSVKGSVKGLAGDKGRGVVGSRLDNLHLRGTAAGRNVKSGVIMFRRQGILGKVENRKQKAEIGFRQGFVPHRGSAPDKEV